MIEIWLYSIISVLIISLISLIGIITFSINTEKLRQILIYMIAFSAGALFGDAFIHLLPGIVEKQGFTFNISIYILLGIAFSLFAEKIIHWRHCHLPITKTHVHSFSLMNLFGDSVHNFIDGLIIGASYLVSIPVGIATTIAVVLHEIPQEIGDFGILIHGGFSKTRALFLNFFTALTSFIGVIISLLLSSKVENITLFLIPFAAGSFIYIAGSDLIPELHKECNTKKSIFQLVFFIFGVLIMLFLLLLD